MDLISILLHLSIGILSAYIGFTKARKKRKNING